ncbi:hypothetical protein EDD15DRAFT_2374326 [Pisolithus albus]|nr:hypothetical protein EDD15DRAFT_2374326 [Pisolithus albus]
MAVLRQGGYTEPGGNDELVGERRSQYAMLRVKCRKEKKSESKCAERQGAGKKKDVDAEKAVDLLRMFRDKVDDLAPSLPAALPHFPEDTANEISAL